MKVWEMCTWVVGREQGQVASQLGQLNNFGDQLADRCHKLLSYSLFSFNNYGVFHAMKFQ